MGIETITDDTFRKLMDDLLKKLNLLKKERTKRIEEAIVIDPCKRDEILEEIEYQVWEKNQKADIPSEAQEQVELVYQFKKKYGDHIIYVKNEGQEHHHKQIAMGLRPGVSDLVSFKYQLMIEMKRTDKGSDQSDKQKDWEKYAREELVGWDYILAVGAVDGMQKIEQSIVKKMPFLNKLKYYFDKIILTCII
jgi:hypothetical protein